MGAFDDLMEITRFSDEMGGAGGNTDRFRVAPLGADDAGAVLTPARAQRLVRHLTELQLRIDRRGANYIELTEGGSPERVEELSREFLYHQRRDEARLAQLRQAAGPALVRFLQEHGRGSAYWCCLEGEVELVGPHELRVRGEVCAPGLPLPL